VLRGRLHGRRHLLHGGGALIDSVAEVGRARSHHLDRPGHLLGQHRGAADRVGQAFEALREAQARALQLGDARYGGLDAARQRLGAAAHRLDLPGDRCHGKGGALRAAELVLDPGTHALADLAVLLGRGREVLDARAHLHDHLLHPAGHEVDARAQGAHLVFRVDAHLLGEIAVRHPRNHPRHRPHAARDATGHEHRQCRPHGEGDEPHPDQPDQRPPEALEGLVVAPHQDHVHLLADGDPGDHQRHAFDLDGADTARWQLGGSQVLGLHRVE
jgi:hypothetical protein